MRRHWQADIDSLLASGLNLAPTVFFSNRKKLRGNAVRDRKDPKAAAVPATVSDEPAPKATGMFREGGKGSDPQARRPAVQT